MTTVTDSHGYDHSDSHEYGHSDGHESSVGCTLVYLNTADHLFYLAPSICGIQMGTIQ